MWVNKYFVVVDWVIIVRFFVGIYEVVIVIFEEMDYNIFGFILEGRVY